MATLIKITAIDAVINGTEYTLPETYVPLQDATTGFDGPGSYHVQLAVGAGTGGGSNPGYVVTYGLAPSDSSTRMMILHVVLTPTGELVFSDDRKLNVGVEGVNATVMQTANADGSYLANGVVTQRTLASGLSIPLGVGTSFPSSPVNGQPFYRTDLMAEFVYLTSSPGPGWFSADSLAQLNDAALTSVTEGDLLCRGASKWNNLAAGASGDVLTSNGAGAVPSWQAASGGGGGFSSTAFIAALLTDSPTMLYEFTETSGTTLIDHSGNGNNGTYFSPTTSVFGVYGAFNNKTAVYFDGQNSYATLPIGLSTSAWTVEILVKLLLTDVNYPCLVGDGHTTSSDKGLTIAFDSNGTPPTGMGLAVRNNSGEYSCGGMGGATFAGSSALFAATFDGTANIIKLYLNGIPIGSATTSGAYVNNGTNPINIGRNPIYGSSFVGGVYDAFATYPAALTQARLQAHYLAMGPR